MKKYLLYFGLLVIMSTSCLTKRKNFTLYNNKEMLNMIIPIKMTGTYYVKGDYHHNNINFYTNGLCNYYELYWGFFFIHNDSLLIQYFHIDQQNFYKRNVIELYGTIINDTSISVYKEKCDWCENVYYGYNNKTEIVYDEPRIYIFREQIKPDSTQAWFINKRWYKKGLEKRELPPH